MRVTSFKAQYRRAPLGSSTPPPPAYEPLSPVLHPVEPANSASANDTISTASSGTHTSTLYTSVSSRAPRARLQLSSPSDVQQHHPPLRSAPLLSTNLPSSPALGSPIDALADAAISSLQASPADFYSPRRPSYALISPTTALLPTRSSERASKHAHSDDPHAHTHQARPSKRARSEFLPSPHQARGQRHSRPATSHNPGWSYNVEQMADNGVRMYQDNAATARHPDDSQSKRLSDAQLLLDFHNAVSVSHSTPSQTSATKRQSIAHPESTWPQSALNNLHPIDSHLGPHYDGVKYADPAYAARASVVAPSAESERGPTVSTATVAVQIHTPPEDYASLVLPDTTCVATVAEDKKPKKPQGWPKGKARGSRVGAAGDKKRKVTPKVKPLPPTATSAPNQLQSPLSLPAESLGASRSEDTRRTQDTVLSTHGFASQTRRHSFSNTLNSPISSPYRAPSSLRAQSVPLTNGMMHPGAHHSFHSLNKANKSRDVDDPICAGCHSSDSVMSIGDGEQWISCDGCKCWFHYVCAGFNSEREVREIDKFYCGACKPKFGSTTSKCSPRTASIVLICMKRFESRSAHIQPSIMLV